MQQLWPLNNAKLANVEFKCKIMKKKWFMLPPDRRGHKILMIMKLVFLFNVVFLLSLSASSLSQIKVYDLEVNDANIKEVFEQIEQKTNVSFFYHKESLDLDKKISAKYDDVILSEVLDDILDETELTYRIMDRYIAIIKDDVSSGTAEGMQEAITVSGTVTDAGGELLPGVNVYEKSSPQNGVITGMDGTYSIQVNNPDDILVFSFIGFVAQEVNVAGRSDINITLVEEMTGLDEVVVVGYGTTTKRKMVSSVSTIETENIEKVPYTNVVQGMAGRTSGLMMRESGGEYGSVAAVSIRGGGEPLYVIDGIISNKGEFSSIPPEDIKEISVLKDASATAVYGMNSADGIILVTTKRGADGDIRVSYSGNFSLQQPTTHPKYASGYDRAVEKNWAANYDGLPPVVSDDLLNTLKHNLDPVRYPDYTPYDEVIKDFAQQTKQNISLNGTMNNTRVYMSLDYFKQNSILDVGDWGLNRYSYRTNISHEFDKIGLTVSGNVSLQRSVSDTPALGTWDVFFHLRGIPRGRPLFNPDGNLTGEMNPYGEMSPEGGYRLNEQNRANGRLEFSWAVPWVKGLTAKVLGNYNFNQSMDKHWKANQRSSAPIYEWDNSPLDMGKASLAQSTGRNYEYNFETHLYYNTTFNDVHRLELTGVYTERESRYDYFSASRKNYASGAVDQLFAGSSIGKDNDGSATEMGRRGYVGRVKYDFASKYIFETSFRYDGNDNFPEGKRWGFFPSVSLGWNMDKEEFMKPIFDKLYISSFKLRASTGITGTDNGIDRFAYVSRYNLINNPYYIGGEWVTGFREGDLVSNDLTWYERRSTNFGIDYGFLKEKISGSFDLFYYRTTGFLGSPKGRYTTPLGKDLPQVKTDSAHRRGGVEFSINYKANIGEAIINVGGNMTYFDQLWEKMYEEDNATLMNPYTRLTHQRDYYTTALVDEGYYSSMDHILNSPRRLASTELKPGDISYQDFNGDGKIDANDKTRIGKGDFPHITYGAYVDVAYKGFSLNALVQGTSNRQMYLGYMWQNELNHKLYEIQMDNWKPENQDAMFPRISTMSRPNGGNNQETSSFWLVDAWYIRLKSLSLSYDFKNNVLKNWDSIGECSLILSGTNLLTYSPVNKYYVDPESNGSENYGYPVQRTFNLGVRLAF